MVYNTLPLGFKENWRRRKPSI